MLCSLLEGETPAENPDPSGLPGVSETTPDGRERSSQPLSCDAADRDDRTGNGEKPEKSRFNVLLGMLTIATMVDVEGETGTNVPATVADAEIGEEDKENRIRTFSGTRPLGSHCSAPSGPDGESARVTLLLNLCTSSLH